MRLILFLVVLANGLVFAMGTGAFGPPPSAQGREPQRLAQQVDPGLIRVQPLGANLPPPAPITQTTPATP